MSDIVACNERSWYVPFPKDVGFDIRVITETAPDIMGAVDIGVGVVTITIGVAVIVGVAVTVYVAVEVTIEVTVGVGVSVGVTVGVTVWFPTHPDNKIASPTTVMRMIDLNCII